MKKPLILVVALFLSNSSFACDVIVSNDLPFLNGNYLRADYLLSKKGYNSKNYSSSSKILKFLSLKKVVAKRYLHEEIDSAGHRHRSGLVSRSCSYIAQDVTLDDTTTTPGKVRANSACEEGFKNFLEKLDNEIPQC